MRDGARIWLGTAVFVVLLGLLTAAPASAVDIIEGKPETVEAGWQAGTCTTDTPECSVATPKQFSKQAASHPKAGFTQIIVKHEGLFETPVGNLKTVLVDLPQGLSVNPEATPQCELEGGKFPTGGCPAITQVGYSNVTAAAVVPPISTPPVTVPAIPVYNLVPRPGEPARFGFTLPLNIGEVFLNAGVKWDGDYHEYFTIHVPSIPGVRILKNRLVFDGTIGGGPLPTESGGAFITTPSTCFDPNQSAFATVYNTGLHADSVEEPAPQDDFDVAAPAPPPPAFLAGSQFLESPLPKESDGSRVMPEGCNKVPFKPTTSQAPGTNQTDSPMGGTVTVNVPFTPAAPIYQSNVRNADVSLPQGLGINPSAAPGLDVCTDAQFGKGTRNQVSCPAGSKIGTAAIDTPPLPDGTLTGNVYLGTQQSRDPASGNEYRIFIDAESASRGLSIRLLGNVSANPQTGQLTAQVHEAPQLPFDSVRVSLDGAKGTLTSPPTCGPNKTSHSMTAWSGTPDGGAQDNGFTLTTAPGGGPCAKTLGARPFAPSFGTNNSNPKGGAFTQFAINVDSQRRQPGAEGRRRDASSGPDRQAGGCPLLPWHGDLPRLRPAAARPRPRTPSCPDSSLIGSAAVSAGSGPNPYRTTGKVFLSGPYHGAPLSLAVITPATAGPFRSRLGRGEGGAVRRSGNGQGACGLRPDPACLRRRPARHPLDRRQARPPKVRAQPDQLLGLRDQRGAARRWLQPARPGGLQLLCGLLAVQGRTAARTSTSSRNCSCGSSAARAGRRARSCAPILVARDGDANIGRAAVKLPKPLILEQAAWPTSARGCSSPRTTAPRTRSTASPKRRRRCSTDR